jgi:hypothetical protein
VQAQKELSDAFTRGIAVSQTRRRIYGVLRLEPHLRCFIGDFDKEAALLDNPQTQEAFNEYIDTQREAYKEFAVATPTRKNPKGDGANSLQTATK